MNITVIGAAEILGLERTAVEARMEKLGRSFARSMMPIYWHNDDMSAKNTTRFAVGLHSIFEENPADRRAYPHLTLQIPAWHESRLSFNRS